MKDPTREKPNLQKFEVGKSACRAKSLILRNIPEPPCFRIGEVQDAMSIDDVTTSDSITAKPIPDFENFDFQIAKQETSRRKAPQPKETVNLRSDHFRAYRLVG